MPTEAKPKSVSMNTTSTPSLERSPGTWTDFALSVPLSLLQRPVNRERALKAIDREIARAEIAQAEAARAEHTATALEHLEAIRERCTSLHGFVQEAWPILEPSTPFVDGWVIRAICKCLEAVTRGEISRLLINVPPGFMKSLLVSVIWPAWEWGPCNRPGLRYLSTSYSAPNVLRDNNKMRRLIESDWFKALWGDAVAPSKKWGEKKFDNTATGGRDGRPFKSMTGGRGDRVVIDDPHSTETAESDADRARAIRIFRESLSDRLNDVRRSAIVIIMQRLHTGDVSGTILSLGLDYVHLMIPMEFEADRKCVIRNADGSIFFEDPRTIEGELAFPERFPRPEVEAMKKVKGVYAWAGQYQQRPAPREGGLFAVDRINVIEALPAGTRKTVRGWDFAATKAKQSTDPDWTVGVRISRDEEGRIFVEDVKRKRETGVEVRKLFIRTAQADGPNVRIRYPQDPGGAGKQLAEDYARAVVGYMFSYAPVTGKKDVRATPFANQMEAGNVYMLRADWNEDFVEELRGFPTAKHDDQVDAASDAFNEVAGVVPGEGLIEYYRQEAEKVLAQARGEQTHTAPEGMIALRPPANVGTAFGLVGTEYRKGPDGLMYVHPDDARILAAQDGWSRVETVEETV